jgi:hypothetical protein
MMRASSCRLASRWASEPRKKLFSERSTSRCTCSFSRCSSPFSAATHVPAHGTHHTSNKSAHTQHRTRNTAHAHAHGSKTCLVGRVWMMMTKMRVVKTKMKRRRRRRRKGRGGGARPRGGCRRRGGRQCRRRLPAALPSPRPRPAGAAFGTRWPPIQPTTNNRTRHMQDDTTRRHTWVLWYGSVPR